MPDGLSLSPIKFLEIATGWKWKSVGWSVNICNKKKVHNFQVFKGWFPGCRGPRGPGRPGSPRSASGSSGHGSVIPTTEFHHGFKFILNESRKNLSFNNNIFFERSALWSEIAKKHDDMLCKVGAGKLTKTRNKQKIFTVVAVRELTSFHCNIFV